MTWKVARLEFEVAGVRDGARRVPARWSWRDDARYLDRPPASLRASFGIELPLLSADASPQPRRPHHAPLTRAS